MSFASALAAVQQKQQQQSNLPNVISSQPSGSGSLSIRGAGSNGMPSTRGVGAALRAAGLGTRTNDGMEVDGARPRRGAGASSGRRDGRPTGPMGDRSAHARNDPYARPPKNNRPINPNNNAQPNNGLRKGPGPRRNDARGVNGHISQAGTELLTRMGNGHPPPTGPSRKPRDGNTKRPQRKHVTPNKPYCFPVDVNEWSFENPEQRALVEKFCEMFFNLWDNDRPLLFDAYHPQATFSNSINTSAPRSKQYYDLRRSGQINNSNAPPLNHWIGPRNLFKHKNSIDRYKKLKNTVDREGLIQHWRALPKTKHPMSQAGKWALDSHSVNGRIILSIQGEFEEQPSGSNRSFSRTFILAPTPESSNAAAGGWPAVIVSDSLVVSVYFGSGAFDDHRTLVKYGVTIDPTAVNGEPTDPNPSTINSNPTQSNPVPQQPAASASQPVPQQPQESEQAQKDSFIGQLRAVTGMNIQYATMCLEGNEWNLEKAWNNFQELKATIPPDAYVQQ